MFRQYDQGTSGIRALGSVLFVAVILVSSSAIVTAAGTNTIIDTKKHPSVILPESGMAGSSNAVTAAMASIAEGSQHGALSFGRAVYDISKSVTDTSAQVGQSVGRATASAATATKDAVVFVGKGVGTGVGFVVRVPGNAVASVTDSEAVSSFMRPSENVEAIAIDGKTSAEQLAQYNEKQRAQIAKLLAEQETANRNLGGTVAAGDEKRGGYPDKWHNARQDSLLDDWGMYNRECVSYAAWKVHQTYGSMPYWGGIGNANQWVGNAKRAGIPTGSIPKVHSVAISMEGYYGHAMWVEEVKNNLIRVSQYNYDLDGKYSEMWIDGSNLTYIYFR